ncbi:MAG: phosphatidate cytidylyltransferase [Chloroflexota bacterium]|nr:phosphatidate cytidylyltransferase [Chloroflexota bacterium]
MLSQRVKAALIFVPLLLIMITIGGWAFSGFITIILLLAALEYARLFSKMEYRSSRLILLAGVLLFILQRWLWEGKHLDIFLSAIIFLAAIAALIEYELGTKNAAIGFAITLTGALYLGWVGSFLIALRALPHGLGWMLTALPATWLVDNGAYFFGRWFGKAKMAPNLSPGKTWAGFMGGVLSGTLSGMLLVMLWRGVGLLPTSIPIWQGALMGLVVAVLTPIGDLLISLLKRSAGVKDTGNLIPGHGGILDRIDTWVWGAMLGYYLVQLFSY